METGIETAALALFSRGLLPPGSVRPGGAESGGRSEKQRGLWVALVERPALASLIFISPSSPGGSPFKAHTCSRSAQSTCIPALALSARSQGSQRPAGLRDHPPAPARSRRRREPWFKFLLKNYRPFCIRDSKAGVPRPGAAFGAVWAAWHRLGTGLPAALDTTAMPGARLPPAEPGSGAHGPPRPLCPSAGRPCQAFPGWPVGGVCT